MRDACIDDSRVCVSKLSAANFDDDGNDISLADDLASMPPDVGAQAQRHALAAESKAAEVVQIDLNCSSQSEPISARP